MRRGGLFFPAIKNRRGKVGALAAGGPTFDGHWQTSTEITLLHRDLSLKSPSFIVSLGKKSRNVLTFPVDLCVRLIESEFLLCGSLVHLRKAFKFSLHQ